MTTDTIAIEAAGFEIRVNPTQFGVGCAHCAGRIEKGAPMAIRAEQAYWGGMLEKRYHLGCAVRRVEVSA